MLKVLSDGRGKKSKLIVELYKTVNYSNAKNALKL